MSRRIFQLRHPIKKISQPLSIRAFSRASNSVSADTNRIAFASPRLEKIAKEKYDSAGRGRHLAFFVFFKEETSQLIITNIPLDALKNSTSFTTKKRFLK
jgi:hypothetical protein